jgi:hypothetical protein
MALALVSRGGGRGALVAVFGHLRWPFDPIRGGPGGSWGRWPVAGGREAGSWELDREAGPVDQLSRSPVHAPCSRRFCLRSAGILPGHDAHRSGGREFGARDTAHGRAALTGYHKGHLARAPTKKPA